MSNEAANHYSEGYVIEESYPINESYLISEGDEFANELTDYFNEANESSADDSSNQEIDGVRNLSVMDVMMFIFTTTVILSIALGPQNPFSIMNRAFPVNTELGNKVAEIVQVWPTMPLTGPLFGNGEPVTPQVESVPDDLPTVVSPIETAVPAETATATVEPTETAVPTERATTAATETVIPPTTVVVTNAESITVTATLLPTNSPTSSPTATPLPTSTPIPPTVPPPPPPPPPPTLTPVPTPIPPPTATPIPPTPTFTPTPIATSANRVPVAGGDSGVTGEETGVTVLVLSNDSDPDGDPLTIISVTQGGNGSVSNNGGSVTYTPNTDFFGGDSFSYTISDGRGGTAAASVSITVINQNDPPTANNDATAVTQNSSGNVIGVLGNDNDVDGDSFTIVSVTQGAFGSVVNNGGNVSYTPNPGFVGTDSFNYTIQDPSGATGTASVQVTVNP